MGRNKLDIQRAKAKYRHIVAEQSQQLAEYERLKAQFDDILNRSRELLREVKPGEMTEEKIRIQDELVSQAGSDEERLEFISKCVNDMIEEASDQIDRGRLKQMNVVQGPKNLPTS